MLKIVEKSIELEASRLKSVYEETILLQNISYCDFADGLYDFLRIRDAVLCIREADHEYLCALRLEPYRNGFLISWLETQKKFRGQGHAKALLTDALSWCREKRKMPVYTHIHKSNLASLAVFTGCGFEITGKPAVFLDGSVSSAYHTLIYKEAPTV